VRRGRRRGLFCNGPELCDTHEGACRSGVPPAADDGIACTLDECDEAADTVVPVPSDAACDDGLFCTGMETCDASTGCLPGMPVACGLGDACVVDACDESAD
jgi:hypothetical protein